MLNFVQIIAGTTQRLKDLYVYLLEQTELWKLISCALPQITQLDKSLKQVLFSAGKRTLLVVSGKFPITPYTQAT